MHTIFHWLQNEVWYRGLRHILLMLWLFSSGKTQKIGCIYRIWVLKFIRASWQEWRFLSNRSSDHDVSHIKQNHSISSMCYKRPHVDIFICVAKKLNWNRGILNERPVYLFLFLLKLNHLAILCRNNRNLTYSNLSNQIECFELNASVKDYNWDKHGCW